MMFVSIYKTSSVYLLSTFKHLPEMLRIFCQISLSFIHTCSESCMCCSLVYSVLFNISSNHTQ